MRPREPSPEEQSDRMDTRCGECLKYHLDTDECKPVRPFSCGTQYMDWLGANCDRCEKGWATECHRTGKDDSEFYENRETICPMECALSEGAMSKGDIPFQMAKRMGAVDHPGEFQWMCPEWEASAEWKAECVDGRNHYRKTERN